MFLRQPRLHRSPPEGPPAASLPSLIPREMPKHNFQLADCRPRRGQEMFQKRRSTYTQSNERRVDRTLDKSRDVRAATSEALGGSDDEDDGLKATLLFFRDVQHPSQRSIKPHTSPSAGGLAHSHLPRARHLQQIFRTLVVPRQSMKD